MQIFVKSLRPLIIKKIQHNGYINFSRGETIFDGRIFCPSCGEEIKDIKKISDAGYDQLKGKKHAVKFQCTKCEDKRQIFVYGDEVDAVREQHNLEKE